MLNGGKELNDIIKAELIEFDSLISKPVEIDQFIDKVDKLIH